MKINEAKWQPLSVSSDGFAICKMALQPQLTYLYNKVDDICVYFKDLLWD